MWLDSFMAVFGYKRVKTSRNRKTTEAPKAVKPAENPKAAPPMTWTVPEGMVNRSTSSRRRKAPKPSPHTTAALNRDEYDLAMSWTMKYRNRVIEDLCHEVIAKKVDLEQATRFKNSRVNDSKNEKRVCIHFAHVSRRKFDICRQSLGLQVGQFVALAIARHQARGLVTPIAHNGVSHDHRTA